MEGLLFTGARRDESQRWWHEVFAAGQLLPFVALFVEGLAEAGTPALLYKIRQFFHSRQESHPTLADLRADHPALLPYAHQQWFAFALEGGAFIAIDSPRTPFFQQTLPAHLREEYFLLFLLALHQRFVILALADRVARCWLMPPRDPNETERATMFTHIRDTLLLFTARGYFAQVMQREHHHRYYGKWQETFQLERLYSDVSKAVQEMHGHLLMQRTEQLRQLTETQQAQAKQLEWRLQQLAILIGFPALAFSFLDINLKGITAGTDGLPWWVVALFGVLAYGFGQLLLLCLHLLCLHPRSRGPN